MYGYTIWTDGFENEDRICILRNIVGDKFNQYYQNLQAFNLNFVIKYQTSSLEEQRSEKEREYAEYLKRLETEVKTAYAT